MSSNSPNGATLDRITYGSGEPFLINRDRQSTKHFRGVYQWHPPFKFELDRLANANNLFKVFDGLKKVGGKAPGIDGLSYDDFSPSEIWDALRNLARSILTPTPQLEYLPQPVSIVRRPKGDGRYRELALLTILDRVVAKGMDLALRPVWRLRLPNFGHDVFRLFARLEREIRDRRQYTLAISDIENCFPSTPLSPVMDLHRRVLGHDDALLRLVAKIIRCQDGTEIGLQQGSCYSPVAMELFLHHCLDSAMEDQAPLSPSLLRYVDNLTFLCDNEDQGKRVLNRAASTLDRYNMNLKPSALDIIDLRYNQNVPMLGFVPGWKDGSLSLSIPEDSFESLGQRVIKAMAMKNHKRVVKHLVLSWTRSQGPALTKAVARKVSNRVIDICNQIGFRSIQKREIRDTAKIAYRDWSLLVSNRN